MHAAVMLRESGRLDVHAAVIARRLLGVTRFTVQRPAMEELLEPHALSFIEVDEIARQRLLLAADVALALVELVEDRRVVIVNALGHDARARA